MVPCLGLSTLASADGKLGVLFSSSALSHFSSAPTPCGKYPFGAPCGCLHRPNSTTTGFSAEPNGAAGSLAGQAGRPGQGRLSSNAKPPLIKRNLAAGTRILLAAIKPLSMEARGRACIITHRIARLAPVKTRIHLDAYGHPAQIFIHRPGSNEEASKASLVMTRARRVDTSSQRRYCISILPRGAVHIRSTILYSVFCRHNFHKFRLTQPSSGAQLAPTPGRSAQSSFPPPPFHPRRASTSNGSTASE